MLTDLRYGLRLWGKRPGFTALVIATLALGIGANTAIFSVINSVLVRPLPYDDPSELFVLRTELPRQGSVRPKSSPPELFDYRELARSFEAVGGIWYRPAAITDDASEPEEIDMGFVSAGFLSMLGVEPVHGRTIRPEEDVENAPRVAVLSHALWERRYGADPSLVGHPIELDGVPHTVVGVMPEGFRVHMPPDAGIPALLDAWVSWGGAYDQYPRNWRIFSILGRLREGVSAAQAGAEMRTMAARLEADYPEAYDNSGLELHLEPLHRDVVAHVEPTLLLLFAAVGFVLLIACANVANLMLVRASGAERELALRVALGANRFRLLRQLVTESALLSFAGAGLGLVLAVWGVDLLSSLEPGSVPRLGAVGLDGRVLAFNLVAAALTAVGFGSLSAIQMARGGGLPELGGGVRSTGGPRRGRLRRGLVVVELALSLIVLIGAGLLWRSFDRLNAVDPGFEPDGVLSVKLSLVDSHYRYSEPEKIAEFYRQLTARIGEFSGVEAVGATTLLPLDGSSYELAPYAYDTAEGVLEWGSATADYRVVTPGWFEAMGARLVRGRFFDGTDDLEHPNVVIVDDRLARRIWPGEDPIGKRLQVEIFLNGDWTPTWSEVVGVVEHLRHHPAREGDVQVFVPHAQMPMRTMAFAIRAPRGASDLTDAIRAEVQTMNPDQPVHTVRALSDYFGDSIARSRFALSLFGLFALLALILAAVGIYGVIAYTVVQRMREIGVRLALGATPGRIVGSIVKQGASMTLFGLLLGLASAAALTRYLSSLLFEVGAIDPATFGIVAVLLSGVALAASALPARRAAKLDPTRVLRAE